VSAEYNYIYNSRRLKILKLNKMKKETIFIKHYIETEDDLPKENGYYFVVYPQGKRIEFVLVERTSLSEGDIWLEEKEIPNDEETEKFINDLLDKKEILRSDMREDIASFIRPVIDKFKSKIFK